MAPAVAEYPPSDPPDSTVTTTVPTQVGGISETNTQGDLAFTGRTITSIAVVGTVLVGAGGLFWLVGQRRRPDAADLPSEEPGRRPR